MTELPVKNSNADAHGMFFGQETSTGSVSRYCFTASRWSPEGQYESTAAAIDARQTSVGRCPVGVK